MRLTVVCIGVILLAALCPYAQTNHAPVVTLV